MCLLALYCANDNVGHAQGVFSEPHTCVDSDYIIRACPEVNCIPEA